MSSSPVEHPLSANDVQDKLVNSNDFRMRLNFDMGDEDVISGDGRSINFRPKIPEAHDANVRIFQTNEIKWVNRNIVVISRYIFLVSGKMIKVESKRVLTPVTAKSCRSTIAVAVKENEATPELGDVAYKYILQRHKKEDELLGLSKSSQLALPDSFALPYDKAFSGMRDSIDQLDKFLYDESSVDPSVSMTVRELQELQEDVIDARKRITAAVAKRRQIQDEIHAQSRQLAMEASNIQTALVEPIRNAETSNTRNDVAFAVSLIPIAVAVFGFIVGTKK